MTTRLSNHIRGVLKTFGMLPGAMRGLPFDRRVEELLADRDDLAPIVRPVLAAWRQLREQIAAFDKDVRTLAKQDPTCRLLMSVPGIGVLSVLAYVSMVEDSARFARASTDAAALDALSGWPSLRTVLAVESIRSVNSAPKVESEIRYFLSSCPDAPAVLSQAIRSHWAVENALHWVLDVTFREDDSRVRDRTAARNLALLRKIALNIVGRDTTSKASVRARRKRAAWNDAYMLQLLLG